MMNINIAVCDDEYGEIEYLRAAVRKWAQKIKNINVTIAAFENAEKFLSYYADNKIVDILLLDIQMNGLNGIELAEHIRKDNETLQIIFITGFTDFIAAGYEVSALHYLIKPVNEDKLFRTLDRAVKKIAKPRKVLRVDDGDRSFKIFLEDIIYIEAFGHSTTVHTTTALYTVQQNIGKIECELDTSFFRCHRSYIAGLKYVRQIMKTEVLFDTGNTIPLSRRIYCALNQAFIRYYREERDV